MIGKKAEEVLNRAVRFAFDKEHEYFTLEHVLLSLLQEKLIAEVIRSCSADPEAMAKDLESYLDREIPKGRLERQVSDKDNPFGEEDAQEKIFEHPVATLSIQKLIQRALFHVQSAGKDEITPVDLLVALFQSKESFALQVLQKYKVERLDVLNVISHGDVDGKEGLSSSRTDEGKSGGSGQEDPLTEFATNLNALARKGKIDKLIGRTDEIERMVQTLCRRRKNNPLLVGEAGVGKTAIVEGLAQLIVEGAVPDPILNAEIFSLDIGSLLAGTKFRGDFEQRIKQVLKSLQARKDAGGQPILFVDEIHNLIGAGSVSGSPLDAANLLKPFLSRGEVQCIGSTTYQEYRNVFEKDHAMARRFQKIDVAEPTQDQTIQILNGLKGRFEEHHKVTYAPEAIKAAVELSAKHMTDRFLPDKAIDLIDEAGARARLAKGKKEITATDIEELVAKIARIPARNVSTNQKSRLRNLDRDLKLSIFGQDHAVDALVTSIKLARSGLRSGEKPVGSFLFCGPTGVGKTELSKQLAKCLSVPFLRFDMSEYMEKHTVSRLIGAPPGYVGFEQAGLLTDAVLKNPHAVVLLDEIEKAHSDLMNILLQVMDYGFLTDNNGKKADFRNIILIMTSNVGTREQDRRSVGFSGATGAEESVSKQDVERFFSPEFRNRLDGVVYFHRLNPVTIAQVVGKQLVELEHQLLAKGVDLEVSEEVREWLAQKGYDPRLGARPMGRLIQDHIKKPLSEHILFGDLEKGGFVKVLLKNDLIEFEMKPKKVSKKKTPAPAHSSNH